MMKFKLPRQEISPELDSLYSKKIKESKEVLTRAKKKRIQEINLISKLIAEDGLPKHLVLQKLKGNIGHGVFLRPDAKPIKKGETIAPYSGEVMISPQNDVGNSNYLFTLLSDLRLTKQEQKKWDPKNKFHPRRLYAINLDAANKGNFTRFINHSVKPNVEAVHLRLPNDAYEIIYIAKKNILPGEQILVCYEADGKNSYWGALKITPFPMTPKTFTLNASLDLVGP